MQIIPMAMPNDQKAAIAESSLIPFLEDIHSIPNADSTENTIADRNGLIPK